MNKLIKIMFFLCCFHAYAGTCPQPASLAEGIIPFPWMLDPFSEQRPSGEASFSKATILVAGFGRGVLCTYQTETGYYSIWWEGGVKIPARTENEWHATLAGFECTVSVERCIFYN